MAPLETFTVKAVTSPGATVWPLVLEFRKFEGEVEHNERHGEIYPEPPPPPTLDDARGTQPPTIVATQSIMTSSTESPRMETDVQAARTVRKIRGTEDHFQHFHSSGTVPLTHPPNVAPQNWRQDPGDVYSHHIQGAKLPQLWVWLEKDASFLWSSVEEGFVCPMGKVTGKILVLPEKFGVSWVGIKTLQRSYPHLLEKAAC